MMSECQRPHPRRSYRRCIGLENPADDDAIGYHVIILSIPLACCANLEFFAIELTTGHTIAPR
jgi:hypothetical protein